MIVIDHSMAWIIWPLLIFGLFAIRSGRWRHYGGSWGRWDQGWGPARQNFDPEPLLKELEAQRAEMDEMAARLAELENRADFTERMLSAPHEAPVQSTSS